MGCDTLTSFSSAWALTPFGPNIRLTIRALNGRLRRASSRPCIGREGARARWDDGNPTSWAHGHIYLQKPTAHSSGLPIVAW